MQLYASCVPPALRIRKDRACASDRGFARVGQLPDGLILRKLSARWQGRLTVNNRFFLTL